MSALLQILLIVSIHSGAFIAAGQDPTAQHDNSAIGSIPNPAVAFANAIEKIQPMQPPAGSGINSNGIHGAAGNGGSSSPQGQAGSSSDGDLHVGVHEASSPGNVLLGGIVAGGIHFHDLPAGSEGNHGLQNGPELDTIPEVPDRNGSDHAQKAGQNISSAQPRRDEALVESIEQNQEEPNGTEAVNATAFNATKFHNSTRVTNSTSNITKVNITDHNHPGSRSNSSFFGKIFNFFV